MVKKDLSENLNDSYENESGVLQTIISEFQKLQPEVRQRLINTIITFFGMELKGSLSAQTVTTAIKHHKGEVLPSFSEDRSMSSKEFLLEKQPQTDMERVACLAFYLTHYRDLPHFKTIDISKLNTEAAQRKFSNATKSLGNAVSFGYLVPATKGQRQLSAAGEKFVQELPDRVAAKNAMSLARPRRKARGVAKSKKTLRKN